MTPDDIFNALKGLVQNRVHPLVAPDKPATPYIVYQRIASVPENTLSDGVPIDQTRLQVDSYADDYLSVQNLATSVKAAMAAAFPQSTLQLEQDLYEQDTKLFRVMHDYSIWS